MNIKEKFLSWWQDTLKEESLKDLFNDNYQDQYERHWTVNLIRTLLFFYLENWKGFGAF